MPCRNPSLPSAHSVELAVRPRPAGGAVGQCKLTWKCSSAGITNQEVRIAVQIEYSQEVRCISSRGPHVSRTSALLLTAPPWPRQGRHCAGAPPPYAAPPAPRRTDAAPPAPCAAPAGTWPAGAPAGGCAEGCSQAEFECMDCASHRKYCPSQSAPARPLGPDNRPPHQACLKVHVLLGLLVQHVARLAHEAQEQAAAARAGGRRGRVCAGVPNQ